MKDLKVKDILDAIEATNIKIVKMHYYVGAKPTHKETLYEYKFNDEIRDFEERIYEKEFQQRLVKAIKPTILDGIEIEVFPEFD